jgi:protein-arginine deiminase
MEFGYAAMPAPGGPHILHAVLRSPRDWALDAWTRDYCLRPDFGYVFKGGYRSGVDWIDWFGNLDCTPPLPGWPLGRVYTGYQGATAMHPAVLAFFEAQGLQGPALQINTDWLLIGHVDEEISFVPADTGTEYRMLMPATLMALQILQDLQDAGKGHLAVFQGTDDQTTVNGLLSWSTFVNYNTGLQADIDGVRQEMKNGLGIAEEDIIDIPALFWKAGGGNRAVAHMPNMVNALVLGDHFITSDPFGPVDGTVDRFKQPVVQALTAIGLTVDFVDNWYPYHEWWGEVHCGTNAVRTPPAAPWWNPR